MPRAYHQPTTSGPRRRPARRSPGSAGCTSMKPESAEKAGQRKMTTLTSAGQSGGAASRRNSGKAPNDGGTLTARTSHPLSSPPVTPPTPQPKPVSDQSSKPSNSTARRCCPYCGTVTAQPEGSEQPCPRCTIEDTAATRAATKARIGPWFVLQSRNPSAPGMRWTTLMELIATGQVNARSIVRGPTTHQLWKFADKVKGLSRE